MHIPDGMLSTPTWSLTWAGAAGFIGYAVREARKRLSDSRVVLMAVLAAAIFALQMLNFPVAGGTSGHFAGGAAAAIILGPWPAVLVMSAVLIVQALVFADGGITALGANIMNMAVIGPFIGWWVYSLATRVRDTRVGRAVGSFAGAWLAAVASAMSAALMVWVSGRAPFGLVMGSMAGWHAVIGVGEGLITAGLVAFVFRTKPELFVDGKKAKAGTAAAALGALAVIAAGVSFLASSSPDGLEHVAESLGFLPESGPVFTASPIPDYVVPGLSNETLAGILAGLVGLVLTGLLVAGLTSALRARKMDSGTEDGARA